MSWSNDVVLEFLDLYRREQLLWDPKHPHHRNRSEVSDAWLRIQTSLSINCSVSDLKKKKESLMTSFRMHWNKKKKSQDSYHTTWFAYPMMESFLGGKYECDSTQMEHEFFVNAAYTTPPAIPDHTAPRNHGTVERTPTNRLTRQSAPNPTDKTTGFDTDTDVFYAKKQMDEAVTYLKKATTEKRDMDEYDLYGQLLAKKLRKLDEHQRDVAMHEIDNIMFRAKMQSGPSQSRSYSSSPSPVPRKMKSPVFIVTQQNHAQYEDENIQYQDHLSGPPPP
ncbi:uncharacterized protein LOC134755372 [Cydia strobilella]|uniref:uncharacterized protein LOC134755372 n=1 Tax=Cydia strobilella TaxID=1100964 RepID=UPI00300500D3